ncbi:hypothetical protein BG842_14045 [Haladaptatus sp. W1]|nr:hypothetical protein BG842_14045 [Haladaptatus sp. W1]
MGSLSRVLAVTPVEQQVKQSVEEARAINHALPPYEPPLLGIELVGRADLHPYVREDVSQPVDERTATDRSRNDHFIILSKIYKYTIYSLIYKYLLWQQNHYLMKRHRMPTESQLSKA